MSSIFGGIQMLSNCQIVKVKVWFCELQLKTHFSESYYLAALKSQWLFCLQITVECWWNVRGQIQIGRQRIFILVTPAGPTKYDRSSKCVCGRCRQIPTEKLRECCDFPQDRCLSVFAVSRCLHVYDNFMVW